MPTEDGGSVIHVESNANISTLYGQFVVCWLTLDTSAPCESGCNCWLGCFVLIDKKNGNATYYCWKLKSRTGQYSVRVSKQIWVSMIGNDVLWLAQECFENTYDP